MSVSTPPFNIQSQIDWGVNAASAPVTPTKRVPDVDRAQVNPQLIKAAEGMEAMFLDYLFQVMRKSVPKDSMDLESGATKIYRNMLDSEIAQRAAKAGGIGLADLIIASVGAPRYNKPKKIEPLQVEESKEESPPVQEVPHEGK